MHIIPSSTNQLLGQGATTPRPTVRMPVGAPLVCQRLANAGDVVMRRIHAIGDAAGDGRRAKLRNSVANEAILRVICARAIPVGTSGLAPLWPVTSPVHRPHVATDRLPPACIIRIGSMRGRYASSCRRGIYSTRRTSSRWSTATSPSRSKAMTRSRISCLPRSPSFSCRSA